MAVPRYGFVSFREPHVCDIYMLSCMRCLFFKSFGVAEGLIGWCTERACLIRSTAVAQASTSSVEFASCVIRFSSYHAWTQDCLCSLFQQPSQGVLSVFSFVPYLPWTRHGGASLAAPTNKPISAFHLLHPELDDGKAAVAQLAVATPPEVNKNYR